MKKYFFCFVAFSTFTFLANAQSKVFKEVGDEIRTQIQPIRQDQSLVGYLTLSQLEKASEDSFNYRLVIMDENLNDIGKLEFREQNLDLQAVAFDQDVICLGYFKSNLHGKTYKTKNLFEAAKSAGTSAVLLQFLTLDGKIVKSAFIKTSAKVEGTTLYNSKANRAKMQLAKSIQVSNVSQKGFTCFFEDDKQGSLAAFDASGTQLWKKELAGKTLHEYILASGDDVYLLSQHTDREEGGWEVKGYGFATASEYDKMELKDKQGNALKVLGYGNNPVTGKPYLSGTVINPKTGGSPTVKGLTKSPYLGVFTVDLNEHSRKDYKETYSYWNDKSSPGISTKGRIEQSHTYPYLNQSFKDYKGNTVFVGSSVIKKTRWGAIATGVVLSPLIVITPLIWANTGFSKYRATNSDVLMQTPEGSLNVQAPIAGNVSGDLARWNPAGVGILKTFSRVTNTDTKSDYVVVDDIKDIVIYNLNQKKIMRTIPHKDGNVRTGVLPAKDGHIMIVEYNKKEKSTRISIEQI